MLAQTTQPTTILTPEVLASISAAIILIVGAGAAALVRWINSIGKEATAAKTAAAVADVKATQADARVSRNAARTDQLMLASPPPVPPRGDQQ